MMVFVGGDYRNRFGRPEWFKVVVTNDAGKTSLARWRLSSRSCTDQGHPSMGHYTDVQLRDPHRWTGEMRTHDIPTVTAIEFVARSNSIACAKSTIIDAERVVRELRKRLSTRA